MLIVPATTTTTAPAAVAMQHSVRRFCHTAAHAQHGAPSSAVAVGGSRQMTAPVATAVFGGCIDAEQLVLSAENHLLAVCARSSTVEQPVHGSSMQQSDSLVFASLGSWHCHNQQSSCSAHRSLMLCCTPAYRLQLSFVCSWACAYALHQHQQSLQSLRQCQV
jgi:hypothetical protein